MTRTTYPDTSHIRTRTIKSVFSGQGVSCAATLHVPQEPSSTPLPAILMVGGWGSVQQALTSSFVNRFVEAGFAVMEFDYPGWGHSAGWPRQDINPWTRVKVANDALAHLKSMPQVDAYKVVLWGTSFGGGHVVDLAAEHPELLGAIIQVPMLDGLAAAMAVPIPMQLKFFAYMVADLCKVGSRIHIPTLAKPGELGSMDRDGAIAAMQAGIEALGNLPYDNRVTARSLSTMAFYWPWKRLKKINIPMQIIGADNDTVAPFVPTKIRRANNPHLQVITIAANHFEPYFEPFFSTMITHQLTFLKSLVPSSTSTPAS